MQNENLSTIANEESSGFSETTAIRNERKQEASIDVIPRQKKIAIACKFGDDEVDKK